jgi:hypothetical protein
MFSVPFNNYILKSATIKAVTIISNGFYNILCTIYDTVQRIPPKNIVNFEHKVFISI